MDKMGEGASALAKLGLKKEYQDTDADKIKMNKTSNKDLARVILDSTTNNNNIDDYIRAPKEDGKGETPQSMSALFLELNDNISDYNDLKSKVLAGRSELINDLQISGKLPNGNPNFSGSTSLTPAQVISQFPLKPGETFGKWYNRLSSAQDTYLGNVEQQDTQARNTRYNTCINTISTT